MTSIRWVGDMRHADVFVIQFLRSSEVCSILAVVGGGGEGELSRAMNIPLAFK